MSFDILSSAGTPPIITDVEPGAHGAAVAGMQGIGVNTPNAAAVADATVGFAMDMHIPKGMMLVIGILSIIVAAGMELVSTFFCGSTIILPGAMPKLHISWAPLQTQGPICFSPYLAERLW